MSLIRTKNRSVKNGDYLPVIHGTDLLYKDRPLVSSCVGNALLYHITTITQNSNM